MKLATPVVAALTAVVTNWVVASCVVLVPAVAVGPAGVPVNEGDANGAPPAPVTSAVVRVTAPARVLNDVTPVDIEEIADWTNCVVATCVVFVPPVAVGAAGVPVKVGDAIGAPPTPVTSPIVKLTAPVRVLKDATPAPAAVIAE